MLPMPLTVFNTVLCFVAGWYTGARLVRRQAYWAVPLLSAWLWTAAVSAAFIYLRLRP